MPLPELDLDAEVARLKRRLERERATRREAEAIAEKGLRDLYDRQRELQLLARVAAAANQGRSVDEVLEFAMREISQFTAWQVGHALVLANDGSLQSSRVWYATEPAQTEQFRQACFASRFVRGIGLPGRVLETGKPLWLTDVNDDTNFPRLPVAKACGVQGAFAFPVLAGAEVVAVLEFFSAEARAPDAGLLDLMSQVGAQLGQIIQRQRSESRLRAQTAELEQARDDATAADRAKSAFLANMSHELRTPLNAIIGFSEIMREQVMGPIPERYRAYAADINVSGIHLKNILNDILDLTKIEMGAIDRLREETVRLCDLAEACRNIITPLADKNGVSLSFNAGEDLPALRADATRLKQIMLNLVSNAVKFTESGGTVSVGARLEHGDCVITVADTGIGMRPQDIEVALKPFRQIDSALNRRYEGTGLGLPLTKAMVELHGGTLVLESAVGEGTTVTVHLPAARLIRAA